MDSMKTKKGEEVTQGRGVNMPNPRVTVVMPTFNRLELLKESLASILNQTFTDYEVLVIDDCSTDGTQEYLREMSRKDARIIYVRNKKHLHYNYGLRLGCKLAKGEYIARMDDDDISLPERFDRQVKFLDGNPEITVVGTFFKALNDNDYKMWVDNSKPEYCAIDAFYRCPLCHPTIMMRKAFLLDHHIGYDEKALFAEDLMLWVDIILAGGKIANIPEVLLKYRVGHARVSSAKNTSKVQSRTARRAREKLWQLCFRRKVSKKLSRLSAYPKLNPDNEKLCSALMEVAEKNLPLFPRDVVHGYLAHLGVRAETMHICFAGDDKIATQMCVAMTSIVRHKRSFDRIDFFILESDMSPRNRERIKRLEMHDVSVEFIRVNEKRFTEKSSAFRHAPVQAYFVYLIPQLKCHYEKVLYLDCDVIARKSLASLWGTALGDNYAAVVQEFCADAAKMVKLKVPRIFNSGMLLLNNKKLVEENIPEILFENAQKYCNNCDYVNRDILNYTFNGKVVWVAPQYNAQGNLWRPETCEKSIYDAESLWRARHNPILVHYNFPGKPGVRRGWRKLRTFQPFARDYFRNLIHTPYRWRYFLHGLRDLERLLYSRTVTPDYVNTRILFVRFKHKKQHLPPIN